MASQHDEQTAKSDGLASKPATGPKRKPKPKGKRKGRLKADGAGKSRRKPKIPIPDPPKIQPLKGRGKIRKTKADGGITKAPNHVVSLRLAEVAKIMLHGGGEVEVAEHSRRNGWGIKRRQVRRYVHTVAGWLHEDIEEQVQWAKNLHLQRLLKLFQHCIAKEQFSVAERVMRQFAKISGFFPQRPSAEQLSPPVTITQTLVQSSSHVGESSDTSELPPDKLIELKALAYRFQQLAREGDIIEGEVVRGDG